MISQSKKLMGLRLSPKIGYLIRLAARERGVSINVFVEQALWEAIQRGEEPNYGTEFVPPTAQVPRRFEGCWDDDPAIRFRLLATVHPELLTQDERRLWNLLIGRLGMDFSSGQFLAAYNDVSVYKTHLDEGGDA